MIQTVSHHIFSASLVAIMARIFVRNGGLKKVKSFGLKSGFVDGVIINLVLVAIFSEIYWLMDQYSENKHFGFESPVDAVYFSTITSSSVGFGDMLPKTKSAKIVVSIHVILMFFILVPLVLDAVSPK